MHEEERLAAASGAQGVMSSFQELAANPSTSEVGFDKQQEHFTLVNVHRRVADNSLRFIDSD